MAKLTWLLVEDDVSIRAMLTTLVSVMWDNLDLLVFRDGNEATEWLNKVEAGTADTPLPELALLDIRMPGPQGHEIAQRLRKLTSTADMTIILMTAYRLAPDELTQIEEMAKPDLVIRKPLPRPDELKEMLDSTLANVRGKGVLTEEDKSGKKGK